MRFIEEKLEGEIKMILRSIEKIEKEDDELELINLLIERSLSHLREDELKKIKERLSQVLIKRSQISQALNDKNKAANNGN